MAHPTKNRKPRNELGGGSLFEQFGWMVCCRRPIAAETTINNDEEKAPLAHRNAADSGKTKDRKKGRQRSFRQTAAGAAGRVMAVVPEVPLALDLARQSLPHRRMTVLE